MIWAGVDMCRVTVVPQPRWHAGTFYAMKTV